MKHMAFEGIICRMNNNSTKTTMVQKESKSIDADQNKTYRMSSPTPRKER